jgi:2'-hydroxyisoflavone reductase
MRILMLGGTLFLGRHIVDAALARGHALTLFHRGRTNPDLFPEVERILGDREQGLAPLRGRDWDVVIDTSGYLPRVVRDSAETLAGAVQHYTFVSSISVYADNTESGITEADAVAELPPGASEEFSIQNYGALKARCERALADAMPGRSLVIRAGLIFGLHDPTDRSGYWPRRIARGGDVLAPGKPERPIQLVDARDLADWIVRMAESRKAGVYNATGPDTPLTMERFLTTCRDVTGTDARLVWLSEDFLLKEGVGPYSELPLWVPEHLHAFETVDCRRAWADGLTFRPLGDTLRDTLAWDASLVGPRPTPMVPLPPSLTAERETELLGRWKVPS